MRGCTTNGRQSSGNELFAGSRSQMFIQRGRPVTVTARLRQSLVYSMRIAWDEYPAAASFDELIAPGGSPRLGAGALIEFLSALGPQELVTRQKAAEAAIRSMGITFTVYHEEGGSIDRAWPLDIIPRTIARREWNRIEAGLRQRVIAINRFIDDIYHEQRIIADRILPISIIASSRNFRPNCMGISPPSSC